MQTVSYEEIIKIQPRGVFTVPVKLRQGLFTNSLARIKRVGTKLIIEPVQTLDYPVRSYTDTELDDFLALDDAESKQLKTQGLI